MIAKLAVSLALSCAIASPAGAAARAPSWKRLASCAAAYRVNAALSDPARAVSMTAQIFETADDYENAAVARYQKSVKSDDASSKATVKQFEQGQMATFRTQSREKVEKYIDACPQPDA